jgi:hypothetical protein
MTETKTADNPVTEAAKQQLADAKEATERSRAEFAERMKGKPTPTQEENDLAALGAHVLEHEHDGSGPDPHALATKASEAKKPTGGQYQTRQGVPKPTPPSS